MATFFCPEFIQDLARSGDANFASRVLAKVVSPEGDFESDADDHRYQGIDGCWIRYVSRQNTAYRAIFIKRGSDVYWYRAGNHSIEDHLRPPQTISGALKIGEAPSGLDALSVYKHPRYLKSRERRYLREVIAARILIPHKSVVLITPRITADLFSPVGLIGRLIQSVIECGGSITVITKPPAAREINSYRWLVQRGVDLLLHSSLNTRCLIFEVDHQKLDSEMAHVESIGIVGSSELTEAGIGDGPDQSIQEELCYVIEADDLDGASEFSLRLADSAVSLEAHQQGF